MYIHTDLSVASREFIIGELSETLIQGCNYRIKIYAKFSQSYKSGLHELEIRCSSLLPTIDSLTGCFSLQKTEEAENDWILFSGIYQASGYEQYILIGSLNEELKRYKNKKCRKKRYGIYVYIDDVSAVPLDENGTEGLSFTILGKILEK